MSENGFPMKFRLEARMKTGGIYKTYSRRIRAISRKISALPWQTLRLTVCYLRDDKEVGRNEGTYHDLSSARLAWEAFTDPDVVAFAVGRDGDL